MAPPGTSAVNELVRAAASVDARSKLADLLVTTVRVAREATGSRYAAMGVIGAHNTLRDFLHVGLDDETVRKIGHLPVGRGVLGTLIHDPAPIVVADISKYPDSVGFPDHHPTMTTFLGVPLRAGGDIFGNLYLTDKDGGYDDDDIAIVETLAAVAGSAIASLDMRERLARLAVAEDRERIARDLHDAVIQDLFAVGLGLQATATHLDDEPTRQRMDDAVGRIDDAIASLRTFIFDLRSLGTLQSTMQTTLENMVGRIAGARGANWNIEVASGISGADSASLDNALLVIREAVSNAVRHGRASNLDITVGRSGPETEIEVIDDGSGFDVESVVPGMGLRNMRARAEDDGGTFRIESSPTGTVVRATFKPPH